MKPLCKESDENPSRASIPEWWHRQKKPDAFWIWKVPTKKSKAEVETAKGKK